MFRVGCTSDKIWNVKELIQYLAQNQHNSIEMVVDPEAVCLRTVGLYDLLDCFEFQEVHIHTQNPFESHPHYKIHTKFSSFWFDRQYDIKDSQREFKNQYAFYCLFHRPTAARLGIAGHLKKHYSDKTILHFSVGTDPDSAVKFEFDKLLSWHPDSVAPAAELIPQLPILQFPADNLTAFTGYDYNDPLTDLYCNCFVDVVVESHVAGTTFFPTEKTVRPMLMSRPFVMFGSRDYLAYLRQQGFRTFADFWNEEYDGYEAGDRLVRIYKVLDEIAALTHVEREKMWLDMQYTLEHNRQVLLSKSWKRKVTRL